MFRPHLVSALAVAACIAAPASAEDVMVFAAASLVHALGHAAGGHGGGLPRQGLLGAAVPGTRTDLVGNRLVLVGGDPAAAPLALAPGVDLAGRLAKFKMPR